jgi:excinuclease ABC subunit C
MLLQRFGSVDAVAKATFEELKEIAGPKTADLVYRYFRP